ncbi:hypothetical protein HNQ36_002757 [Afipia massiliensis]|uniref:Uncharacterized protein n=1 Tax=Afipia massiliensis TaxID=211460 RepID=A0A840MY33_9BRAD|nr:hypothetical protein [Afipia massiliensis]MBB5052783.1 hypothetical protein [Afipia massiliensis]
MKKPKKKTVKVGAMAADVDFQATAAGSITEDEIYHRLEWFFDPRHDPAKGHSIDPNTPIEKFFQNMDPSTGRTVLWVNINKASPTYFPAWRSALFHGVQFPWTSQKPIAIGIRDIQNFGKLIDSAVLSYQHVGWQVS